MDPAGAGHVPHPAPIDSFDAMRLAYFDCFSGISGDMALAALMDAGAKLETFDHTLASFPLGPFEIEPEHVDVGGISATQLHVRSGPQGVIQTYGSIRALLEELDLPPQAKRAVQLMYHRLANAAATVHAKEPDLVTFHEFGDVDCMVEFVGVALALHELGVERVFASPVPTGMGMARTEHGVMPIPSPIVMELLQGVPTYSRGMPVELVTPTGAAILAAVSEGYGDMPMMRADHVGYGAGHLRLDFPNALRVVIGEEQRTGAGARIGSLEELTARSDVVVEVSFEDDEPNRYAALLDALDGAGAADVRIVRAYGPSGSKGLVLSFVAPPSVRDAALGLVRAEAPLGHVRVGPLLRMPE